MSKVQNYSQSIELKKQQLASLEAAVDVATKLFQNARVEYIDVLFAQRDRNDARIVLIETKQEQLSAIVNAYQALGGGWRYLDGPVRLPPAGPVNPAGQIPAIQPLPSMPARGTSADGACDPVTGAKRSRHRAMGLIPVQHREGMHEGWAHWIDMIRLRAERK